MLADAEDEADVLSVVLVVDVPVALDGVPAALDDVPVVECWVEVVELCTEWPKDDILEDVDDPDEEAAQDPDVLFDTWKLPLYTAVVVAPVTVK